jgi:hypothetical protein
MLSETWLDEAENAYLKGFDVVRKERIERAGGPHMKIELRMWERFLIGGDFNEHHHACGNSKKLYYR